MKYNQIAVTAISDLEASIEVASMDSEMRRKVLSLLGSVEYQVEEGPCPTAVLVALQDAIISWLKHLPEPTWRELQNKVEKCFLKIKQTME